MTLREELGEERYQQLRDAWFFRSWRWQWGAHLVVEVPEDYEEPFFPQEGYGDAG